jgi:sugar lactone lactonase YvrE
VFRTNRMRSINKAFASLLIASLETILVSISAHAGGLAFDRAGNLFMADPDSHSIFKFTPDGKKSTFASGLISTSGVYTLAFDAAGDLFVPDEDSRSIFKFTPDGKKSTFVTGITPLGIAFDRSGNLFVSQGGSILKFTPDGKKSTFATGSYSPGMAFDDKGNLFVADLEHSIFKFTPDGTRSTFANDLSTVGGSGFETNSMVFDRSGNLFESDERGQRIIKFSPDGTESAFASGVRGDLAFDGAGNLFVADHVSRSILKFTPDGTRSSFTVDVSSVSPDKKWEFVGGEEPRILDAATKQVVLEISEGRGGVVWAPDSKRFGFNYSVHGHRGYTFESVAFYELRGEKWEELGSPADNVSKGSQLVQLLKEHLPKKFNPRDCSSNTDVLDLREWTDASNAILYAPCYRRNSEKVKAGFLFTLKFDAARKWKIVKTHQMSEKEIEKIEKGE